MSDFLFGTLVGAAICGGVTGLVVLAMIHAWLKGMVLGMGGKCGKSVSD